MSQRDDIRDLLGTVWADRYEVLDLLGRGGMGAVFKARHIRMDREVALKVIHRNLSQDDKQVLRFEQEARTSSRLNHPNSIRVYDYGKTSDGRLFMAMEYLHGVTLAKLLSQEGALPPDRVLHMVRQILKALAEAHGLGLVHRDLKPENIFICDIFGERDFVKVLDFGIAKAVGPDAESANLTKTGFICGTPRYLSPEQALGQDVDGRADLYSVGVLMYEMLSGRPPFVGENPISIVMKHVHEAPPPLPKLQPQGEIGGRMAWLVDRLLAKNPADRPSPAQQVVAWLDGHIDASHLVGRPVSVQSLRDGAGSAGPTDRSGPDAPVEVTAGRPAMEDPAEHPPPPMPSTAAEAGPPPRPAEATAMLRAPSEVVAGGDGAEETSVLAQPQGLSAPPGQGHEEPPGPAPAPGAAPTAAGAGGSTGEDAVDQDLLTSRVRAANRARTTAPERSGTPPWAWALMGVAVTMILLSGVFWWWSTRVTPSVDSVAQTAQDSASPPTEATGQGRTAAAAIADDEPSPRGQAPGEVVELPPAEVAAPAEPIPAGRVAGRSLGGLALPAPPPVELAAPSEPKSRRDRRPAEPRRTPEAAAAAPSTAGGSAAEEEATAETKPNPAASEPEAEEAPTEAASPSDDDLDWTLGEEDEPSPKEPVDEPAEEAPADDRAEREAAEEPERAEPPDRADPDDEPAFEPF